ncbi:hypothetical protein [Cryptosporangium phraense]|uniref:Uncharacterized protein n=1 Tax=Cryptosporangium phraense TaxID=2593070 RepID=A0A545AZX1_9ACTN|nr:hypothetical protein [Cryptosporangium phraense]TQS46872.1 hypothetical protein FL583_00920 [Cryptosporangium phraense]
MVGRVWIGLVIIFLGVVGLLLGWQIEENGDNVAVLAVFSALAVAAGCLVAASAGGEVAVRATGGLLFAAGLVVAVTNHDVSWWLPSNWQAPVSLTALVISLAGLGVLLLAFGFSLAGLSGGLGLLGLACLALDLLPYIGSDEQSVLRAGATALGAVALTAGVSAAAARRTRVDRRVMTGVAAAGAAVIVYAGYDSYGSTSPGGYRAAVIVATLTGATASLALGAAIFWPRVTSWLP